MNEEYCQNGGGDAFGPYKFKMCLKVRPASNNFGCVKNAKNIKNTKKLNILTILMLPTNQTNNKQNCSPTQQNRCKFCWSKVAFYIYLENFQHCSPQQSRSLLREIRWAQFESHSLLGAF